MKPIPKPRLFLIFFSFIAYSLNAQESNYSKILSQNQKVSPSFTGEIPGSWRIMTNYQSIKTATFKSQYFAFTFDMPVYLYGQKFGIGVHALNDDIGGDFLTKQKFQLALAYHPVINNHVFSFGTQLGYVSYKTKLGNELWPDQYNDITHEYDPYLSSNETINGDLGYIDLGVGAKWRTLISNFRPEFGINVLHINSPEASATYNSIQIDPDVFITSSLKWDINDKYYALSELLYNTHHADNQITVGEIAAYVFTRNLLEKSVFTGGFFNIDNGQIYSFTALIGTNYNQFHLALSYDLNFSKANRYTSIKGPFEITLSYMAISGKLKKIALPCMRF